MKKLISFSLLLMLPFCMMAQEFRVLSPDGLTYLNVKLADGRLTYNAGYRTVVKPKKKGAVADTLDVPMILDSPLGLYTSVGDLSKGLKYIQTKSPERYNHTNAISCYCPCSMLTRRTGAPVLTANDDFVNTLMRCLAVFRLVHDEISYRLVISIVTQVVHESFTKKLRITCGECQITCWDDEIRITVVNLDRNTS